jgi:hypothetical protein
MIQALYAHMNNKIKLKKKKMCYICTMEFYSVIQKSEIMLFAGKWIELENNMLSEVSQAQKVKKPNVSPHVEARPIS